MDVTTTLAAVMVIGRIAQLDVIPMVAAGHGSKSSIDGGGGKDLACFSTGGCQKGLSSIRLNQLARQRACTGIPPLRGIPKHAANSNRPRG